MYGGESQQYYKPDCSPKSTVLENWFLENIEAWKNAWDISLQPTFSFSVVK